MNVDVSIGGGSVKSHVLRYEREHKICTGIGMFSVELDISYGGGINTWDEVTLEENGKHVGTYFVCQVDTVQPDSCIKVTAQDHSKYLVDYYISQQYFIDYPTTARYWIVEFLEQAGITKYKFLPNATEEVLLSNNTTLGMMSAYDQIMYLLQICGWYMHFDKNGTCIIGKLDTEMSRNKGRYKAKDILEMQVVEHDKMLRNRVVVWGRNNDHLGTTVFSEASTITPWNYDKNDYRSLVISNSNIPSSGVASSLAHKALSEFEKLTVEKHAKLHGAKNLQIGDVISLNAGFTSGRGLITTFGTEMSQDGLITKVILDERCPRLFAYFDLGDFVYIGTVSSGVWRRHIKFNWANSSGISPSGLAPSGLWYSGWENFSSGLHNLAIADLHIANGSMGCVTQDGSCFVRTVDDGYWSAITMSGLTILGSGGMPITYSGDVKGRAVIVDRESNTVKFAVDTGFWDTPLYYEDLLSGLMSHSLFAESGILPDPYLWTCVDLLSSGISSSSVMSMIDQTRGWIVDTDPYNVAILNSYPIVITSGILGSGITFSGVQVSGLMVIDLEEGGNFDYVSVMVGTSGVAGIPTITYGGWSEQRNFSSEVVTLLNPNADNSDNYTLNVPMAARAISIYDNSDEKEVAYCDTISQVTHSLNVKKYITDGSTVVESSSKRFSSGASFGDDVLHIHRCNGGIYRIVRAVVPNLNYPTNDNQIWVSTVDYDSETVISNEKILDFGDPDFMELTSYNPNDHYGKIFIRNMAYFAFPCYAEYAGELTRTTKLKIYKLNLETGEMSVTDWYTGPEISRDCNDPGDEFLENVASSLWIGEKTHIGDEDFGHVVTMYQSGSEFNVRIQLLESRLVTYSQEDLDPPNPTLPKYQYHYFYETHLLNGNLGGVDIDVMVDESHEAASSLEWENGDQSGPFYIEEYERYLSFVPNMYKGVDIWKKYNAIGTFIGSLVCKDNYYTKEGTGFIDRFQDGLNKFAPYPIYHPLILDVVFFYDNTFHLYHPETLSETGSYELPCGWVPISPLYIRPDYSGLACINAQNIFTAEKSIICFEVHTGNIYMDTAAPNVVGGIGDVAAFCTNVGSFFVTHKPAGLSKFFVWYLALQQMDYWKPNYFVLSGTKDVPASGVMGPQEEPLTLDGSTVSTENFSIIYTGIYPHRLDVSKFNPLMVADWRESSLAAIYVDGSGITIMESASGMLTDKQIFDFCYTDLAISGIMSSGGGEASPEILGLMSGIMYSGDGSVSRRLLYTLSSGLMLKDIFNIGDSGNMWFSLNGTRLVETTNYAFDGQYVFLATHSGIMGSGTVVTSGIAGSGIFYQKDPDFPYFLDSSSGIPMSDITIIRVDEVV